MCCREPAESYTRHAYHSADRTVYPPASTCAIFRLICASFWASAYLCNPCERARTTRIMDHPRAFIVQRKGLSTMDPQICGACKPHNPPIVLAPHPMVNSCKTVQCLASVSSRVRNVAWQSGGGGYVVVVGRVGSPRLAPTTKCSVQGAGRGGDRRFLRHFPAARDSAHMLLSVAVWRSELGGSEEAVLAFDRCSNPRPAVRLCVSACFRPQATACRYPWLPGTVDVLQHTVCGANAMPAVGYTAPESEIASASCH